MAIGAGGSDDGGRPGVSGRSEPGGDAVPGVSGGASGRGRSDGTPGGSGPSAPGLPNGRGGSDRGLWVGDEGLIAPAVAVGTVRDNLEDVRRGLTDGHVDALLARMLSPFGRTGIFGDSAVESAWSAFHRAWTRETGVTSSAVAQVAKLLPESENKQRDTDRDGARETRRAVPDVPIPRKSPDVERQLPPQPALRPPWNSPGGNP